MTPDSKKTTSPLLSLALLKGLAEQHNYDYLDALRRVVFLVITKYNLATFTETKVRELIAQEFGLLIPANTILRLFKRLSKDGIILQKNQAFQRLNIPNVEAEFRNSSSMFIQHNRALLARLCEFVKTRYSIDWTTVQSEEALDKYLEKFSVDCIRAHAAGNVVEIQGKSSNNSNYLVSSFANHISSFCPEEFQYLLTVLQGKMIAEAIVGEELIDPQMKFHDTTLFLDTRIVLNILGLHGSELQSISQDTINLAKLSGGKIAVFEHTLREVDAILRSAEDEIDHPTQEYRKPVQVLTHLRSIGATRANIVLVRSRLEDELKSLQISIEPTPSYESKFQIDEVLFEQKMTERASRYQTNPYAKRHDIQCVRSIFVLRRGTVSTKIEKCKAIFITPNSALYLAARDYNKTHNADPEASPVLTEFYLTNYLWLKHPLQVVDLPKHLLKANLYGALKPDPSLWAKYVNEVDNLAKSGRITNKDVVALKTELKIREDLMDFTHGDPDELDANTVTKVLNVYQQSLIQPHIENLEKEREAHVKTLDALKQKSTEAARLQQTDIAVRGLVRRISQIAKFTTTIILVIAAFSIFFVASALCPRDLNPQLKPTVQVITWLVSFWSIFRNFVSIPLLKPFERIAVAIQNPVERMLNNFFKLNSDVENVKTLSITSHSIDSVDPNETIRRAG